MDGEIKYPNDEKIASEGRIIGSQLSEHQAEGWLEGIHSLDETECLHLMNHSCEWLILC